MIKKKLFLASSSELKKGSNSSLTNLANLQKNKMNLLPPRRRIFFLI